MTAKEGRRTFVPAPRPDAFHCACIQAKTRIFPATADSYMSMAEPSPQTRKYDSPGFDFRAKRTNTAATLYASHPLVFLGGYFGVSGTPPGKPLECKKVDGWVEFVRFPNEREKCMAVRRSAIDRTHLWP